MTDDKNIIANAALIDADYDKIRAFLDGAKNF